MLGGQFERIQLARRRLIRLLDRHGIAIARTIEQKIADAGPFNQRIDPHILTNTRRQLMTEGRIEETRAAGVSWYYLPDTAKAILSQRLAEQAPIHRALSQQRVSMRLGQALEIAVFRTLTTQSVLTFFGQYHDLEAHDDRTLYRKEDPPSAVSGRHIPGGKKLDFLVFSPTAGLAGIEVKNVREWQYIDREDILELLLKCCALDAVPVLIARRIPFVTFRVLNPCGVILHQTYNQRFPEADHELAAKAKDKRLLGFHDIRLGNQPDARLETFIHHNLPQILPRARERFDAYRDLLERYARGTISYEAFTARVRRREQGLPEDTDFREEDEEYPNDEY